VAFKKLVRMMGLEPIRHATHASHGDVTSWC